MEAVKYEDEVLRSLNTDIVCVCQERRITATWETGINNINTFLHVRKRLSTWELKQLVLDFSVKWLQPDCSLGTKKDYPALIEAVKEGQCKLLYRRPGCHIHNVFRRSTQHNGSRL